MPKFKEIKLLTKKIRFTSSTKNDNKVDSGGKKSIFRRKNTNNDKKLAQWSDR